MSQANYTTSTNSYSSQSAGMSQPNYGTSTNSYSAPQTADMYQPNDTASTYSYNTISSTTPLTTKRSSGSSSSSKKSNSGSKTQAVREWSKQLVADIGYPPTRRYDMEHGRDPVSNSGFGPYHYGPNQRT